MLQYKQAHEIVKTMVNHGNTEHMHSIYNITVQICLTEVLILGFTFCCVGEVLCKWPVDGSAVELSHTLYKEQTLKTKQNKTKKQQCYYVHLSCQVKCTCFVFFIACLLTVHLYFTHWVEINCASKIKNNWIHLARWNIITIVLPWLNFIKFQLTWCHCVTVTNSSMPWLYYKKRVFILLPLWRYKIDIIQLPE